MDVNTYDRETHEGSYYESTSKSNQNCYGCYLLNKGEGGENQFAHMDPGGCLYEEFSDEDSSTERDFNYSKEMNELNEHSVCKEIPRIKTCINCTDVIIETYSQELFCSECQTKEDRQREVRYQTFVADFYASK